MSKAGPAANSDDDDEQVLDRFRTLRADPFDRWGPGDEPVRPVEIRRLWGDTSATLLLRQARIELEPAVLPVPRFDGDITEAWDLNFLGRWNAIWSGSRLRSLSLDCFSAEIDWVPRLVFEPDDPVDLLVAYNSCFPGMWGLTLIAGDMTAENARGEIYGHRVSARDPRLAIQIASRCPGVAELTTWLEVELDSPTKLTTPKSQLMMVEDFGGIETSLDSEYSPGAELCSAGNQLAAVAAMAGGSSEPPPVPFIEPVAATMDTYTLVAAPALGELREADLINVPSHLAAELAAHVTFADAISAIRNATSPLPLWLDFTDSQGEPLVNRRPGTPEQPLYGVMVLDYDDEDDLSGPARIVVPVGRTSGLIRRPMPLCALAIGPDDRWRYQLPDNVIGLLTAHRGGVAVRNVSTESEFHGTEPPISQREIAGEIAGCMARTTEWILARVGAVLVGLDDGYLQLRKIDLTDRSYELVSAPATRLVKEATRDLDARVLVAKLRALGSMSRVAEVEGTTVLAVREVLQRAGVDPGQVRRDEVLQRFRRTGSVEAIVSELHIQRSDVERLLAEAGIEWNETPVPHDTTDPDVLEAIAMYREEGTLDGAGARLGVSSETVRRRLHQAGLSPQDVVTDARLKSAKDAVDAWRAEGESLAGAARRLKLDPRTVKQRLREAGVSDAATGTRAQRASEARKLNEVVQSPRSVAALMGISVSTVRRYLGTDANGAGPGRPRITSDALDQAELAVAEHGSVRAAARALGMSVGGLSYRLKIAQSRSTDSNQ